MVHAGQVDAAACPHYIVIVRWVINKKLPAWFFAGSFLLRSGRETIDEPAKNIANDWTEKH